MFNKLIFNQFSYFIIGVLILSFILFPLSKKMTKQYRLNQEIEELNQEINRLEGHNNDFKNIITYLESDEFAEEEARTNLNLKKPGEDVVVIKTKDENVKDDISINKTQNLKNIKNPENWWNYFFKIN